MPSLPTRAEIEQAAALVARTVPPTPQYAWPLLAERAGCRVWVKHENHTPIGSFKLRGGVVYLADLRRRDPATTRVVAATHGLAGEPWPARYFASKRSEDA